MADSTISVMTPNLEIGAVKEDGHSPGPKFSSPDERRGLSKGGSSKAGKARRQSKLFPAVGPTEQPAELFRKDLISAMKLADSEHLESEEFWQMQDPWRQEWERGVQVPVGLTETKNPVVRHLKSSACDYGPYPFKFPKKLLHAVRDEDFQAPVHELHECHKLSEEMCRYDLDELDNTWLQELNIERSFMGEEDLPEWQMETVMEALETQCYNNMQTRMKTEEGLGIEYDETVVCDVCQSPESEDSNEMIFCDGCDVCVHQGCYGVTHIPTGNWLCRPCALGVQPSCKLCPVRGGAMKSSKSGSKWAHVSCALWIPEVTFHNPDRLEYIANIKEIPASRWSLVCSLCREKVGACIQCSVKTCKTAFHVTCAFKNGLDMQTLMVAETVELKAFCMKHSKKAEGSTTPKKTSFDSPKKLEATPKKEEMSERERNAARTAKVKKLEEEFYNCVTPEEISEMIKVELEIVSFIFSYWVLKRKANFNLPLILPKTEEADLLSRQREDSLIARMKMFIHLRQDLERVRNLCYMVSRREKIRRQVYNMQEQVFRKQVQVLDEGNLSQQQLYQLVEECRLQNSVYNNFDAIFMADAELKQRLAAEAQQEESDFEMTVVVKNSSNQLLDRQLEPRADAVDKNLFVKLKDKKLLGKSAKKFRERLHGAKKKHFSAEQAKERLSLPIPGLDVKAEVKINSPIISELPKDPMVEVKLSPRGKPAMNEEKTSFQTPVISSGAEVQRQRSGPPFKPMVAKKPRLSFEAAIAEVALFSPVKKKKKKIVKDDSSKTVIKPKLLMAENSTGAVQPSLQSPTPLSSEPIKIKEKKKRGRPPGKRSSTPLSVGVKVADNRSSEPGVLIPSSASKSDSVIANPPYPVHQSTTTSKSDVALESPYFSVGKKLVSPSSLNMSADTLDSSFMNNTLSSPVPPPTKKKRGRPPLKKNLVANSENITVRSAKKEATISVSGKSVENLPKDQGQPDIWEKKVAGAIIVDVSDEDEVDVVFQTEEGKPDVPERLESATEQNTKLMKPVLSPVVIETVKKDDSTPVVSFEISDSLNHNKPERSVQRNSTEKKDELTPMSLGKSDALKHKVQRSRRNSKRCITVSSDSSENDDWLQGTKRKSKRESLKKMTPRGKEKAPKVEIIGSRKTYKFEKKHLIVPQYIRDKVHTRFQEERVLREKRVCTHHLKISNYVLRNGKVLNTDESSTDSYSTAASVQAVVENGSLEDCTIVEEDDEVSLVIQPNETDEQNTSSSGDNNGRPRRSGTSRSWMDFWKDSVIYS